MGLFGVPLIIGIPLTGMVVKAGITIVGYTAVLIAHSPLPGMVASATGAVVKTTAKVVTAPIRAGIAVAKLIDSVGDNSSGHGGNSGNTRSNGNGSSSTSDVNRSSTNNGGTSQSNQRETEHTGAGGNGNGGGGNGNGDRKKTDHEMDIESEDEDNNNENQTQQRRTSRRRVSTAWREAVDLRDPSEDQYFIRFRVPDGVEQPNLFNQGSWLPHVGPYQPRSHLVYRSRMFFYGIGRLQKLCNELGLNMNDICQFGTSVYRDARPGRLNQAPNVHAAHVFPVTDFNFELIRARMRQCNKTQEQINELENMLKNMVGVTQSVHRAFNAAGTVGRALDNFLRDFIQENRNVNYGNIQQIVNSMVECLRQAIKPESREEIEAAIQTIQSTSASEWMGYFNDGLKGVHDNHFNQTRRTIDDNIRNLYR